MLNAVNAENIENKAIIIVECVDFTSRKDLFNT